MSKNEESPLDKLARTNPALYRALIEQKAAEKSLYAFTELMWPFVEPANKFIGNWHLEVMAEHLEAVTSGDITRLLINIPPGTMKACDINTIVPTDSGWKKHGDLRPGDKVFGSDGRKKKINAVTPHKVEDVYEVIFDDGASVVVGAGHLWEVFRDTPNQKSDKRGKWKRMPQVVSTIDLRAGDKNSSRRCADSIPVIKSIDTETKELPIDPYLLGAWLGDGDSRNGIIYCGDEDLHHFKKLGHIVAGTGTANRVQIDGLKTLLRENNLLGNKHIPDEYLFASHGQRKDLFCGLMDTDGQISPDGHCRFTSGNAALIKGFVALAASLGLKPRVSKPFFDKAPNAKKRGPYYRVRFTPPVLCRIFRLGRKQKRVRKEGVIKGIHSRYVVSVKKIGKRKINCINVDGGKYAVTENFVITHNSLMVDVMWPAWEWLQFPHYRYVCTSYSSALTERDNIRFGNIVKSDLYQSLWGEKFKITRDAMWKVENNKTGWKIATSTEGMGTGERGNRVIVDDPHNVKDGESDAVRKSTLHYFTEVLPSRVTDPILSAMVVIMQRVHEEDVSGHIIKEDLGYTHLILPMEFDPRMKCTVWLPKQDPAVEEPFFEDPREEEGELLFPERMPDWVIARDKKVMGPYACNTGEAPILMSDLSMKPICDIKAGDELVGFIADTQDGSKRRSLTKCIVLEKYERISEVVKITLSSGKVIRCTADHKWYMGKQAKVRKDRKENDPIYQSAKVGRRLMRVCDPSLPDLTIEQQKTAGWLAGFFDGEGTASLCKKENHKSSCAISLAQTCERNLPVCERLERSLRLLGFSYSIDERSRHANNQRIRHYRLTDICLPTIQRFIHLVGPVKWRDRIIEGAYRNKWIRSEDEVLSIEPDGHETVFSMKTTTGNYIVWGLASSNCAGQFQQSPAPRGGGIIKRDYWKLYPPEGENFNPDGSPMDTLKYPPMRIVIATVDTAYTEKKENDYSALGILGVWDRPMSAEHMKTLVRSERFDDPLEMARPSRNQDPIKYDNPGIMLMHSWKKRLQFRGDSVPRLPDEDEADYRRRRRQHWGLLEWVAYECSRFEVDFLLIENKASGITLSQEIKRVYGDEKWVTTLVDPKGDKVARVYSVQHLFAEGMVYAPQRAWAEDVISSFEVFPKGAHDDDVDAITQGVRWLRDNGWALRRDDVKFEEEDRLKYTKPSAPLYDV